MTERERSFALMTAFTHGTHELPESILPTTVEDGQSQCLDLAMIASALLINWSREVGVDPTDLLTDIALGQALDATTR
jgi:hypothetical protein